MIAALTADLHVGDPSSNTPRTSAVTRELVYRVHVGPRCSTTSWSPLAESCGSRSSRVRVARGDPSPTKEGRGCALLAMSQYEADRPACSSRQDLNDHD